MNRPALVLTDAPPVPATRHLTALNTPEQIRAHVVTLKRAARAENRKLSIRLAVFVGLMAACVLGGYWLLRVWIAVSLGAP